MNVKMMWPLMALLVLTIACESKVDDKPAAEVKEPQKVEKTAEKTPEAKPEGEKPGSAEPAAGAQMKELTVKADASKIGWTGAKITGDHTGEFKAFTGKMMVDKDGKLQKVMFEVDTSSVTSDNEKLTGHLKSPDFFDVAKFPKASFESTEIKEGSEVKMKDGTAYTHTVTGNLKLHGVEKAITFPALVKTDGDMVEAKSKFTLNRFDFKIEYKGKADDLIKKEVLLDLDIKAPKA